jgi:tubulin polyglutamylase TTLL6/13
VTSCSPLRVYLFRDGLVRMCAEAYKAPTSANMGDVCLHLTNYAVNKRSKGYVHSDLDASSSTAGDRGCKRSVRWFLSWVRAGWGEDAASGLWSRDICALTIASVLPLLRREYSTIYERRVPTTMPPTMQGGSPGIVDPPVGAEPSGGGCIRRSRCFELLGYIIMVGSDLRPILIEVTHLPSWGTDTPIDRDVKFRAITQALRAIDLNARDKNSFECARRKRSLAPIAAARRGSSAGGFPSDDNAVDAMDLKGSDNEPNGDVTVGPMDGRRLDDEERMLKDYDRIYPPSDKADVSQAGTAKWRSSRPRWM